MKNVTTLEEAIKRIEELENENAKLREELEYYKNRKLSGRQKHNAKWMAIYNDFVDGYESGMTMVEIAKRNNVSERTIYRYKAYYDKMTTLSSFELGNLSEIEKKKITETVKEKQDDSIRYSNYRHRSGGTGSRNYSEGAE